MYIFLCENDYNFNDRKGNSMTLPFVYQENRLYFTPGKHKKTENKSELFKQYFFQNKYANKNKQYILVGRHNLLKKACILWWNWQSYQLFVISIQADSIGANIKAFLSIVVHNF